MTKNVFKNILLYLVGAFLFVPVKSLAATCNTTSAAGGVGCAGQNIQANLTGPGGILSNVIIVLITLAGIISVIMIIVGGLRYVFSAGNEKATAGAKDTILYAVIGLIICVVAFAIVTYITTALNK